MSEGVLIVLKFCFLALVYLFLFRIVRTVATELRPAKIPVPAAAVAPTAAAGTTPGKRERGGRSWELVIIDPPALAGETFSLSAQTGSASTTHANTREIFEAEGFIEA